MAEMDRWVDDVTTALQQLVNKIVWASVQEQSTEELAYQAMASRIDVGPPVTGPACLLTRFTLIPGSDPWL